MQITSFAKMYNRIDVFRHPIKGIEQVNQPWRNKLGCNHLKDQESL
jgi:hypothetical protein